MRYDSIGRVHLDHDLVPTEARSAASHLQDALDTAESDGHVRNAEDHLWSAKRALFDAYDFGAVGDSNSVWGRQERLVGTGPIADLHEAARALGFIPQFVDEQYPQPNEKRTNVFVSKLSRYFPFDHELNHPTTDIVIAQHSTYKGEPTHIEVGAADPAVLRQITYGDPERNPDHSVLRYTDVTVDELEDYLRKQYLSYARFGSYVSRMLPEREWDEYADEGDYRLVLDSHRNRIIHAPKDGSPACGTTYDNALNRILARTVTSVENRWSVQYDRCQHPACQHRF